MNWLNNLCSCISPQLKQSMIDYLNSTSLNQQVIEQQKCTEQIQQSQCDPSQNVYARAKAHSYNFMKLGQGSDDEDDYADEEVQKSVTDPQIPVINVFWYPASKQGSQWEHYHYIFEHKNKLLEGIFADKPNSGSYDKVYDSQDQMNLTIYCKLESLIKGKKINSYRFCFNIASVTLQDYAEIIQNKEQKSLFHLLQSSKIIDSDPNDKNFTIKANLYKKLLVISPHELLLATKTQSLEDEQIGKYMITTAFSVFLEKQKGYTSQGWLHLGGLKVIEGQKGLTFQGFMSLQLDVSVSPNMLKQPISKEIRIFVQKLVCSITKSDGI